MGKMEKAFNKMDEIRNTCINELEILYEIFNSVNYEFSEYLSTSSSSIISFEKWQKKPLQFFSGNPIFKDGYVGAFSPYALNILKGNGISVNIIKIANGLQFKWKLDLTLEHYADEDINSAVTCYKESILNCGKVIEIFYLISDEITKNFNLITDTFESAKTPYDIEKAVESSKKIHGKITVNEALSKKVIADIKLILEHYEFNFNMLLFEQYENKTIITYEIKPPEKV